MTLFRARAAVCAQSSRGQLPVCARVCVCVYVCVTQGLEDQLLGEVVRKERPELEEQRDRLVVSISGDKKQLVELEDKVRTCVCVCVCVCVIMQRRHACGHPHSLFSTHTANVGTRTQSLPHVHTERD